MEFYGDGLDSLTLSEDLPFSTWHKNTVLRMQFLSIDKETIDYLNITGRDKKLIKIIENYAKTKDMEKWW